MGVRTTPLLRGPASSGPLIYRMLRRKGHDHSAFGHDRFGRGAESFARFFGTPGFLVGQTIFVIIWMIVNAWLLVHPFDPPLFIGLNLIFSTQAAYAAPLLLLASTRQADRDKKMSEEAEAHRDELASNQQKLLEENTRLTEEIHMLSRQLNDRLLE